MKLVAVTLAIATVALLAVGCADADAAADRAVMKDSLDRLEEQVKDLEAALERIEDTASAGYTLSSAPSRSYWTPPAAVTEDMDEVEAAAICITDKMFAMPFSEVIGDEVLEAMLSELDLPEEDEEAWLEEMGPVLRYLFCGF